jgi:sporulation protein YlmC with PRC-barrel domain
MDTLYELMDQGIVDPNGERCGRVDDLEIEEGFDRAPRVTAILSGGGAKSRHMWRQVNRLSVWLHHVLGWKGEVAPARIPWEEVEKLDQDVHIRVSAGAAGLDRLNRSAAERIVKHIPGAGS